MVESSEGYLCLNAPEGAHFLDTLITIFHTRKIEMLAVKVTDSLWSV